MNSRLLLKLLSISLIALILFSCGTSSNGFFEKRKHLKGWYFKKNNINSSNVSVKKSERDLKIAQNSSNPEIADKSGFDFLQKSKVEFIDSVMCLVVECEERLIQLESFENTDLTLGINAEKELMDNDYFSKPIKSNDAFLGFLNEPILNQTYSKNLKTMSTSFLEIKEMNRYHPFSREPLYYIKMFGLFVLILALYVIIFIGSFFIILELSVAVGIITLIIGVYFATTLQDFLKVRILNESWGDHWTFGDSMIRIGILFGVLAAIGLLVYAVGTLFDF